MREKKGQSVKRHEIFQDSSISATPKWPTTVTQRLSDGRIFGTDKSCWLYMVVPQSPVENAKTLEQRLSSSRPLDQALTALADLTPFNPMLSPKQKVGSYRKYHLLLLNSGKYFEPPIDHPNYDDLYRDYADRVTFDRLLVLGVKLEGSVLRESVRDTIDTFIASNMSDDHAEGIYDNDFVTVRALLSNAGLRTPSAEQMLYLDSWFNLGKSNAPYIVDKADHLTILRTQRTAEDFTRLKLYDFPEKDWGHITNDTVTDWHSLTFATVRAFNFGDTMTSESHNSQWFSRLLDMGAYAVSVRGRLEPPDYTKKALDERRREVDAAMKSRMRTTGESKMEEVEERDEVFDLRHQYAQAGTPPATSRKTQILVAFSGYVDVAAIDRKLPMLSLDEMTKLQFPALAETWPASKFNAAPYNHDLQVNALSFTGATDMTGIGDYPRDGAILLGLTESEVERQSVWFSPRALYDPVEKGGISTTPCILTAGNPGSGKTVQLLYSAHQLAKAGYPVVIIDPSPGSDMSAAVKNSGGYVASLDNLLTADGMFDPLRSVQAEMAAEKVPSAHANVLAVRPWASRTDDFANELHKALNYGVSKGARCTGQALLFAKADGVCSAELCDPVIDMAVNNPLVRAFIGIDPQVEPLAVRNGITCIRVGEANLQVPVSPDPDKWSYYERITVTLMSQIIYSSLSALAGRNGVIMLDEGHVFLSEGGSKAIDFVARVARKMAVALWIFTQKVGDVETGKLNDWINTAFIFPLGESEAARACKMADVDSTPERISRIVAGKNVGQGKEVSPNWGSLWHQNDKQTGRKRGSLCYMRDKDGRTAVVENIIPDWFLATSRSDNESVQARRKAASRN